MTSFVSAEQAKKYAQDASLNMAHFESKLAQMIEANAKEGNTVIFTVLPKHLPLEEIRKLAGDLTQLGYHVRFEVSQFYYTFNVHWA